MHVFRLVLTAFSVALLGPVSAQEAWHAVANPATGPFQSVVYGQGGFIAGGAAGEFCTSPDGLNWTRRPTGFAGLVRQIAFGAGRFVAVVDNPLTPLLTSSDGFQ